jgi:hypothetical protein
VEAQFLEYPDANCGACLCQRSECYLEAYRLYLNCDQKAFRVGDFFVCETNYDSDRFGCWLEYNGCIFSPFR